ncbi:hypothetical protein Q8791_23390 [Nocardiopsis sp. CT-R113]|uniref:Uncharacterized protein n=1 Tax=Nocardiopsis codii TaxID=3065942 RepID=A0ABU7KD60_9ACTN|nr:hypothetical protein [Nocardiopsis sp. CT-R113]MEE2040165.1 hypothetical protein [Nocardiopsis sp. CT-R113]
MSRRIDPASIVRTLLPYLVGAVAALGAKYGITLPDVALAAVIEPVLEPAVAFVVGSAYYLVGRFLETSTGATAQRIGRLILSFGLTAQSPVYIPAAEINAARPPRAGA